MDGFRLRVDRKVRERHRQTKREITQFIESFAFLQPVKILQVHQAEMA